MTNKKTVHGFALRETSSVPELCAELEIYEHEKSGAQLLYINRSDENMTFAISFKTLPEDDTGVFHILEHSVLCGSDKYPVKEPFVELLKSSLKTFLNAFTFPDKTMYPVSSRNGKDFLNLINVYMDAVLHPLAISKPEIFCQEGWHHEISDSGELSYKGVVFNEMKGAYSSVDELEMSETAKLIYEGSVYGYDSGGDPKHIPDLTFEQFCRAHAKYYHPSNSRIILDGSIDLDSTLALLDGYLCEYDAAEPAPSIPLIRPRGVMEKTVYYEIGENENGDDKARLCLGFLTTPYDKIRERIALSVITDAIAGSNEAPFKKAMLDAGICEDVCFFPYDGIAHNSILLEIKNLREKDLEGARSLALGTLRKMTREGFPRDLLAASLSRMEFRAREQDGAYPAGLSNVLSAMDGWLHGADPKKFLSFEDDFAFMRAALETDFYEKVFEDYIVNSDHFATVRLLPSKERAAERIAEENARLAEERAKLTEEGLAEKRAALARLEKWQSTPDSKEALSALPSLSISDLSPSPQKYDYTVGEENGRQVVFVPAASKGIFYADLLFDISDFGPDGIFKTSLLCDLLKNLKTDRSSAVDLQTAIKNHLGAIYFSVMGIEKDGETKAFLRAHMSFLESNLDKALDIMKEITAGSDILNEGKVITNILKQTRSAAKENIISSGHSAGIGRIGAYTSAEAAINEYTDGIEFYLMIKDLVEGLEEKLPDLLASLDGIKRTIFTKERLTAVYTGKENAELAKRLTSLFESGAPMTSATSGIRPLGIRREGISIPSQVAYACMGANLRSTPEDDPRGHGSLAVVRSLLSLDYLWSKVRVQGGAYGSGLTHRITGSVAFYSYRDPSPARSIDVYRGSAEYLRDIADSKADLTGNIIGTVGDSDFLITPKLLGVLAIRDFVRKESYEDRAERRRQTINTTHEDIRAAADRIKTICEGSGICIVAGADKLAECRALIDTVIEL